MVTETKPKNDIFLLPEAQVLWHALFERDVYKDKDTGAEGKPKYGILLAADPNTVTGEGTIEDKLADAIAAMYGEAVADEFLRSPRPQDRISPLKNGDAWAKEKEAAGKEGDAAKGKIVFSADSIYNKDGKEGPGGFTVYGPDCSAITAATQDAVYPGCYGILAVTLHTYKDYPRKGDRGVKFYMSAFQKTRDGEVLKSASSDKSSLFKPVGGAAAPSEGRRRRVG